MSVGVFTNDVHNVPQCNSVLLASTSPYLQAIRGTMLEQFVHEQIIKPPTDILCAYEELALVRETASRIVQLYAAAREAEIADPANDKKRALTDQAAFLLRESMGEVVKMCEAAARIASTVNRAFSWAAVNQIVLTAMRSFQDSLGGLELAEREAIMAEVNNRMQRDFAEMRYVNDEDHELQRTQNMMDESVPVYGGVSPDLGTNGNGVNGR